MTFFRGTDTQLRESAGPPTLLDSTYLPTHHCVRVLLVLSQGTIRYVFSVKVFLALINFFPQHDRNLAFSTINLIIEQTQNLVHAYGLTTFRTDMLYMESAKPVTVLSLCLCLFFIEHNPYVLIPTSSIQLNSLQFLAGIMLPSP